MARRRKKQESLPAYFARIGFAIVFFVMYWLTNSLEASAIATGLYGAVCISIFIALSLHKKEKLKKSGIADIDTMDGKQFEHYLKELFISKGYKAEVTSAAGDFGADLILHKEDRKIVVQAKRYSNNVGIKAIQEVVGSKAHYLADEAWAITNRDFTPAAYKLAESNQVKLINRDKFIDMVVQMNPEAIPNPKTIKQSLPEEKIICDRCGQKMVFRKSTKGAFYGCSSFPRCRYTKVV